ncbi:hypothetical protein [Actinokineospora sp. HUAS TT18]|uniref:hypothetical protein n=1 Tax=Actinokineospora sp. HUAS TT18 TaxID=3447451 RepID=UPI003F527B15
MPKDLPLPPSAGKPGHPEPSGPPPDGPLPEGPVSGGPRPGDPSAGGPLPGDNGTGPGGGGAQPGGSQPGGPGVGEPGNSQPGGPEAGGPGAGGPGGSQPAGPGGSQSPGYWDVDPDKLDGFALAVTSARFGLAAVQARVERMQGDDYTPKLGTSPVGQQLAKKFDDRLNGDQGLRGLLAEAMRRMDQFIESAEKVRDSYRESEDLAQDSIKRAGG